MLLSHHVVEAAGVVKSEKFTTVNTVETREADDQYAVAAAFYAQQQWDLAAEEFELFLDRYAWHGKTPDCVYYLGESLLQCGQFDKAQRQFDRYLEQYPKGKFHRAAAFRAAETAYLRSNYSHAKRLLQAFGRRYAEDRLNAYVLPYLGSIALAENDAEAAADAFRRGLSQFPQGPLQDDCRLGLARALVKLERFAEAVRPLEDYLADDAACHDQKTTGDDKPSDDQAGSAVDSDDAVNVDAQHDAVRALGQLAICYIHCGDFAKTKSCHARLMEEHLGNEILAPIVAKMAEDAYQLGETVWSARLYEWLADDSGREEYEIAGLAGLAWSRLENRQKGLACAAFGRLLQKDIEPSLAAEAAFMRGRLFDGMQRCEAAMEMYSQVIDRYASSPQHPKALLAAARLQARRSRGEQTVELYERLAREYPSATNIDTVLYEWSWALQDLGRTQQAVTLLERIHRELLSSRFWADATYRLAAAAFDAGDLQRSAELIERIVAAESKRLEGGRAATLVFAYALRLKWQIAALREDWPQVEQAAARLLRDCPRSELRLMAEYWVAEAAYRRGEYAEVAKLLDDLSPRSADVDEPWAAMALLRRAQIFFQQKQIGQAMSLASEIPERFADFEQLYEVDYLLGRCRAARAEFAEARRDYERVIRSPHGAKTETAAMAQWMIGESFFHQKDYRAALKAYHRVETLYDYPQWQSAALLQAAKCQRLLGRPQEAAKLCRRLMDKYPQTPFVEEAARRLRTVTQ